MIDNFEQIKRLLVFEDKYDFYFVQVLQRNKENPFLGSNNHLVKSYSIFNLESLDKRKDEMIKLAKLFNARIYIHLNKRNIYRLSFELMEDLAKRMKDGTIESLYHIYDSTCGKHHQDKNKKWIIDIDTKDRRFINEVLRFIEDKCDPIGQKFFSLIETKNGFHLITYPFNTQQFNQQYKEIEIHKENPTLIYCT